MKAKTKRGLRGIVLWINRIAVVIVAVCFVLLYVSSVIEVKGDKSIYHYQRTPIERRSTDFEDSSLFTQIVKDQIADITRMCVIRNQMETNGVYNGRKIIDISSFANCSNSAFNVLSMLTKTPVLSLPTAITTPPFFL